jgi:hypothetical protein
MDDGQNAADCNTLDELLVGDSGTYTPDLTALTTDPTLGNSVITGRWQLPHPSLILVWIRLVIGSTFVVGSGTYRWSLPVAPHALYSGSEIFGDGSLLGKALFRDSSAISSSQTGVIQLRSATVPDVSVLGEQGSNGFNSDLGAADGDIFNLFCKYVPA